MKIKKFKEFNEGIFFGEVGPNYGEEIYPSTSTDIQTITYNGKIWMKEDYMDLLNQFILTEEYQKYLRDGGTSLQDFNLYNIITIIDKMN